MPSQVSTVPCQIDGLQTIYIYNESVCFEFENEEQLNKVKREASMVYKINPPFEFLLSKKPIFAFTITRPVNISIHQFILNRKFPLF